MSITLQRTTDAAMPDRPWPETGHGLRIAASPGTDGQYLPITLDAALDGWHLRFYLHPRTLTGPAACIIACFDSTDASLLRIVFDPTSQRIELNQNHITLSQCDLPDADWHAIEVGYHAATQTLTLSLDGLSQAASIAPAAAAGLKTLHLGLIHKHNDVSGQLDLDEIVIDTSPIGPVLREPIRGHGDDPARWLILFNAAEAEAWTWARAYQQAWDIPYANMLGLSLSHDEQIDLAGFESLRTAIVQYLADTGLEGQILGILCGYRVPGRFVDAHGEVQSTASALHTLDAYAGPTINPLFDADEPTRLNMTTRQGCYLAAQMDCPTLAEALDWIDLAQAATQASPDAAQMSMWTDPHTDASAGQFYIPQMQAVFESMAAQDLRVHRHRLDQTAAPGAIRHVDTDGFFIGWVDDTTGDVQFATPAGVRALAIGYDLSQATDDSRRTPSADRFAQRALSAGYAAVGATVRVTSSTSLPRHASLFRALRLGWTLAEAWFAVIGNLRDGRVLLGDPLVRVTLPQRGYQVLGPADDPLSLRARQPGAILPADAVQHTIATAGYWAVRPIDAQGRVQDDGTWTQVLTADHARHVSVMPAWPRRHDWPLVLHDGMWQVVAIWPGPIQALPIREVQLWRQAEGEPATLLQSIVELRGDADAIIRIPIDPPETATRYRFTLVDQQGQAQSTPWSAPHQQSVPMPAAVPLITFTSSQP